VSFARTAELIEVPFWMWTLGLEEACIRWGAHWRNLVNTMEPSMSSSDVALCQITLTTCLTLYCDSCYNPPYCPIVAFYYNVLMRR